VSDDRRLHGRLARLGFGGVILIVGVDHRFQSHGGFNFNVNFGRGRSTVRWSPMSAPLRKRF
jgi:hypothetical protein